MNRLKQITTKAKALYKTGKYAKWTDAIKAASKQTATVGATKKKTAKKKAAPKKKTAVKKVATKKKATTRNYGSHKDTASHNVRISVVSGTDQMAVLNYLIKEKNKAEQKIIVLKKQLKESGDYQSKRHFQLWINKYKDYLKGLKKSITESKKHV
jgi:F0F1-type ATP synthase membrane subunit b/b'